jgi:hypothetical protein
MIVGLSRGSLRPCLGRPPPSADRDTDSDQWSVQVGPRSVSVSALRPYQFYSTILRTSVVALAARGSRRAEIARGFA